MRYQAGSVLGGPLSTRSRRSGSRLQSTPVVAVICLLVGFVLGGWNKEPIRDPYPVDMAAFEPRPATSEHIKQQAGAAASGEADVRPPALSNSMYLQQQQQQQHSAVSAQTLDVFGKELLVHSHQLPPPVTPGKSGNTYYTVAPHQVLSWYPRIILFPRFLDNATVAHIIALAKPLLQPSGVGSSSSNSAAANQATDHEDQLIRNSDGVFLDRHADPSGVLAAVEERIAAVTFIPPSHGEAFNVLRYRNGQHYHSHMDTFDPKFVRTVGPAFGQRMATMILYLTDVDQDGETVFKREGKYGAASLGDDDTLTTCEEHDFKYKPRAGDAMLFYSMHPDLSIDPRALHGACPVRGASEKWVVTKWLHDKPIDHWDGEAGLF